MNKSSVKKHFVFDLDDTLVDGRQFCGETMARAITQLEPQVNFDLVVKMHDSIRGLAVTDLYKTILSELSLSTDIPKLLELDKKIQEENFHRIKVFDGVVEILDFLKSRNKKLYICTNRIKSLLVPILEANKIAKYFDEVISCIDAGYKKPNPKCLLDIVERSGDSLHTFIYFGDSEVDSEFAKNAGIEHIIFDQYLNDKNLFKKLLNLFLEDQINGDK